MASFVFLLFLLFLPSPEASEEISVKSGDDVILSCRAVGVSIIAVKWTRTDLESEYVYVYTNGRSDPTNQHPSFKGRVQLVDNDLKDGDVSLILKNVNKNDTGTYKCRVYQGSVLDENPVRRFRLEVIDSEVISVKPGDDITLPCQADDVSITAVEWTRTEPSPPVDILIYKDGQSVSQNFLGRVQLEDSDLKDGDVSLILKNVNKNDRGTYECRVHQEGSGPKAIRSIRLEVIDSGGDHGWIAGGVVSVVVVVVVCLFGLAGAVVVWIYKRRREQKSNPPAVDEAVKVDLL